MPRYVILRHALPPTEQRGLHWDLMLEHGHGLKTWALPEVPREGISLPAQMLADHRLHYLDYEGPISENRGSVTRWDAGTYHVLEISDTCWRVQLQGTRLQHQLLLQQEASGQRWTVALLPA